MRRWVAAGEAAGMTSDGFGGAAPPAGPHAARAYIAFSNSAISTKAKPTELSAMP